MPVPATEHESPAPSQRTDDQDASRARVAPSMLGASGLPPALVQRKLAGRVAQRKAASQVDSETTSVTGFARGPESGGQTYGHGAFMGAAGEMMRDATWTAIFKAVWPDEYARVSQIDDVKALMGAMENNPILAAYGEARSMEKAGGQKGAADPSKTKVVPQEWDVWLDPADPGNLAKCKIAHGTKWTTVRQNFSKDSDVGYKASDVKAAKNGGQWMELFGKAIAMYRGGSQVAGEGEDKQKARDEAMHKALAATTAEQAVQTTVEFLKKENGGGLVLDVKSTYSKPADINHFIDTLKAHGVHVIGVGTFRHEQLAGLEEGVRPVKFFHGLQGLQNASDSKQLKKGDHVMFNGGTLLDKSGGWIREEKYGVDQSALQSLVALQKTWDLNIALYVQETDVDPKAVDALVKLVNKLPNVFREGFAYGNVNGQAEKNTKGTGLGAQSTPDNLDKLNQKIF